MRCSGNCFSCHLCSVKVVNENLLAQNQEPISPVPVSEEEEHGASLAFDKPIETGLSVVEIPQYELKRNILGKEKIKRIK